MDNNTLNTMNAILQEWAIKLGTTVEKLIPEVQKYYIVQYIVTVIAWAIVFVIMIIIGKHFFKRHNEKIKEEDEDYDDLDVWGIGIWAASIVPFIAVCYFTTVLLQWIVSPSASLVGMILRIMSNKG